VAGGSLGHVTGFSDLLRENTGCDPRHLEGLKRMAYLVSLLAPDAGLFRATANRFPAGSLRGGLPASVEMIG
jgi:hypothetical protein